MRLKVRGLHLIPFVILSEAKNLDSSVASLPQNDKLRRRAGVPARHPLPKAHTP